MVARLTNISLKIATGASGAVLLFSLFVVVRGAILGYPSVILIGLRQAGLAFFALAVLLSLFSITKRLTAIERNFTEQ